MASFLYNSFSENILNGAIDVGDVDFYALLVTDDYTPDDAHENRDDITNEASGTGYSAGGVAVSATLNRDDGNDRVDVTFGEATYSTVTLTDVRGVVIYVNNGGASSGDPLVAYVDLGSNKDPTASDFKVTFTSPLRIQKGA